ncbi:hypothetical protein BH11MYX2_BH11MYX2_12700 [soil metagenome]
MLGAAPTRRWHGRRSTAPTRRARSPSCSRGHCGNAASRRARERTPRRARERCRGRRSLSSGRTHAASCASAACHSPTAIRGAISSTRRSIIVEMAVSTSWATSSRCRSRATAAIALACTMAASLASSRSSSSSSRSHRSTARSRACSVPLVALPTCASPWTSRSRSATCCRSVRIRDESACASAHMISRTLVRIMALRNRYIYPDVTRRSRDANLLLLRRLARVLIRAGRPCRSRSEHVAVAADATPRDAVVRDRATHVAGR